VTIPTNAIIEFANKLKELELFGIGMMRKRCIELGMKIREICVELGYNSVAHESCQSPTVVVCFTREPNMVGKFKQNNVQIAGGLPFKCDEKFDSKSVTFRIGLFGIEK